MSRSGVRRGVRVPVEPLVAMFGGPDVDAVGRGRTGGMNHASRVLGFDPTQLRVWRRQGGILLNRADELAIGLGMHPSEIWHDDWWKACEREQQLERDRERLSEPFEDDDAWPWDDWSRVPAHECASDGCRCGQSDATEVAA